MLYFLQIKYPHNKRLLRVLILLCVFQLYLPYWWEIELGHGGHEVLVLVSGGCVGELYDLEDRPEETLSAIVTLGFTHSVVEGVLDIRGV